MICSSMTLTIFGLLTTAVCFIDLFISMFWGRVFISFHTFGKCICNYIVAVVAYYSKAKIQLVVYIRFLVL